MQKLLIAIETVRSQNPFTVTSAAWFDHCVSPTFNPLNLTDLHRHLIASTHVHHTDLEKAVNAAVRRTIEVAYLRGVVPTTNLNKIQLRAVLKPYFRAINLTIPVDIVRSHWLITAARTLLKEKLA